MPGISALAVRGGTAQYHVPGCLTENKPSRLQVEAEKYCVNKLGSVG
ncbi:MAG: hypothetical protein WA110_01970 [Anaerolineaceae bacterium]